MGPTTTSGLATGDAGMAPPDETLMSAEEQIQFDASVTDILQPPSLEEQFPGYNQPARTGISLQEAISMGLDQRTIEQIRLNEQIAERARLLAESGEFGVVPDEATPQPLEEPLSEESGRVSIGPVGPVEWLGSGTATGAEEPHVLDPELEGEPMADLSGILGTIGRAIGGSLDADPATPGIFGGGLGTSLPDVLGGIGQAIGGSYSQDLPPVTSLPSPNGAAMPTTNRDAAIAAALGVSPNQVAAIKKYCRTRRRRRRMLTKSDIADISTMASLLGKSSEAFKTWLATQRLSR